MPFANARLNTQVDGILYADRVTMPSAEGDLSSIAAPDRTPLFVGAATNAIASVVFTSQGAIVNATAYVVMQTQIGDENAPWYDVAWCNLTAVPSPGSQVEFLLATAQFGPAVFQQTRAVGAAPTPANSYNSIGLGGRIRFVGKDAVNVPAGSPTSPSSRSSSSAAFATGILVTIRVKLQQPR